MACTGNYCSCAGLSHLKGKRPGSIALTVAAMPAATDEPTAATSEEERFSTKNSFFGFDEAYYAHSPSSLVSSLNIWPPAEKHKVFVDGQRFTFNSGSASGEGGGVGIYAANPECLQAVGAAAMSEWLQSVGLQCTIRNRATESQIVVYIKNMICTRKESYEIQVRPNKIIVLAADYRGVLYAMHTLKQLIVSSSSTAFENSAKILSLPCLLISDAPSIGERALRLSWRFQVAHSSMKVPTLVRMLSILRFNIVFLDIDCDDQTDNGLYDLNVLCSHQGIQLVPLVTVTATDEWKDFVPALKFVGFERIALHILDGNRTDEALSSVAMDRLKMLYWCCDQGPPPMFQNVEVKVVSPHELKPPTLDDKPLAMAWTLVDAMVKVVEDIEESRRGLAVLPVVSERDFLTPDLLVKYYCALFAGVCYRGVAIKELMDHSSCPRLMDAVLSLIVRPEDKISEQYRGAIISMFSSRPEELGRGPTCVQLIDSTTRLERAFWSLVLCEDARAPGLSIGQHAVAYPSAEEAFHCYNYYKNILQKAHFKATSSKSARNWSDRVYSKGSEHKEADELFASVDMLTLISRTVHILRSSAFAGEPGAPGAAGLEAEAPAMVIAEIQSPAQKRAAVYDNIDMSRPYAPKVFPKSQAVAGMLVNVVQHNILFRNFKTEEHSRIVEAFDCIVVKAGETVIRQGDAGEYFYIVESGLLEVYMESCGVHVKIGRTLAQGDYFGELALMYNTPRAATVISTELSTLWRIDRHTYRTIVMRHNKETSDEFHILISNVLILNKRLGDVLSPGEISKVVSTLEVEEFEHDSVIVRQHQTGDYFYIISEGQVDVWQDSCDPAAGQRQALGVKVATLRRGDYFGEKALLADDVRQASCVAVGRVVCLSLSRDDFIAMIGNWQDLTGVRQVDDAPIRKQRQASVYDSNYHISICLDDLDRLNTLGVGAFGRVSIARHKESGQLYALKAQSKAGIISNCMQEMVLTEVKIMRMVNHPLIAKLHATMQDKKSVYFLLELLPGGEFFNFLQKMGKLSEEKARFYSASVVSAYEELHRNRIAYRDLKPENMVMDARGYVKLVDFGLAKQLTTDATWTMCGTPDYLAPEIILNKGHGHAVDYWALGVLIFEMIHGWPPFYHDQPMRVYEKIILGKVSYPDTFSKPLEDIISKFLVTNPSKRLGNMKGALGDVTKHKWFGSFDWLGLAQGTLLAPFVPDLTEFDTAIAGARAHGAGVVDDDYEDSEWMPEL